MDSWRLQKKVLINIIFSITNIKNAEYRISNFYVTLPLVVYGRAWHEDLNNATGDLKNPETGYTVPVRAGVF